MNTLGKEISFKMQDNKRRNSVNSTEPGSLSVRLSKQHVTNVNKSKLTSGGRFREQNLSELPENLLHTSCS